MTISRRKQEHIDIASNRRIRFRRKTNGFEKVDFVHCALPELNLSDIETGVSFLGRELAFPLMITAITGGFPGARKINADLAETCQTERIALGLGSQRQLFENDRYVESYRIVRQKAPDIPLVGNIGAAEIIGHRDFSPFRRLVDLIEADALAVHLNALQERLQPEGGTDFRGVLDALGRLVRDIPVPVIVKETGCGVSRETAQRLADIGVRFLDVAGAGGTSWAGIESFRSPDNRLAREFWDWGIPTAFSLRMASDIPELTLIASGGLENGIDLAKAVALGARLGGAALPFLGVWRRKKLDGLISEVRTWKEAFRTVLWLTGSASPSGLRREHILYEI
ncbi:MAG TPA: type 2 isopentenyl-diphosphate Delta-isomerase [bacterium]|nr:type 2 isopentenyl-diphosphate Delta-isomerase [bacterium]